MIHSLQSFFEAGLIAITMIYMGSLLFQLLRINIADRFSFSEGIESPFWSVEKKSLLGQRVVKRA